MHVNGLDHVEVQNSVKKVVSIELQRGFCEQDGKALAPKLQSFNCQLQNRGEILMQVLRR